MSTFKGTKVPNGVMFNAYPDSIGQELSDIVAMLSKPEFRDVFSIFYILPTFFHSDLDRGFSIVDYDMNEKLVSPKDIVELARLNIALKLDLVLNHLSVGSPQFQDMLTYGDASSFKDFFIDWNEFWKGNGEMGPEGHLIPKKEYFEKLFMRKPGLPILKVRFPDGSERPYWNTFYQKINYPEVKAQELRTVEGLDSLKEEDREKLAELVNQSLAEGVNLNDMDLQEFAPWKEVLVSHLENNRQYLGQMDLNARSPKVWEFYEETFQKLQAYGCKLIRLDAFAYLHKEPGQSNFFNKPGTWEYLAKLKKMAEKYDLTLLPEIHSEYGSGLHEEVAGEGYPIYDFFFPGLVIQALDRSTNRYLLKWIKEIQDKKMNTINMMGCHDGIPILDLKGTMEQNGDGKSLLGREEIDKVVFDVMSRGGRTKNLYGPDGKKIAYYQVNATFYSALGEDDRKFLLARAIQLFMPGIPLVWYLDLFAGKNDYEAADRGGIGGHKEINRTTLSLEDVEAAMEKSIVKDQLELLRFRNTCSAFRGELSILDSSEKRLQLRWSNDICSATLDADLENLDFSIMHKVSTGEEKRFLYNQKQEINEDISH
jgi:sucrose phosphorylase